MREVCDCMHTPVNAVHDLHLNEQNTTANIISAGRICNYKRE